MSGKGKTVVVFGASGQQGGWAAKLFKAEGYTVIGVSRSAGRKIASCDKVVSAELTDADGVASVCAGADVVFGLTQPWGKNGSVNEELEKKQAEGLARGVAKAKVPHFIFTSVISTKGWEQDEFSQMPHLRQKWVVNRLVQELKVPTTMLGPAHFMDNWDSEFLGITEGQINGMMEADVKVPYVACRDIGKMATVAAKLGPPESGTRYLPVITEFVSGKEIQAMMQKWHKQPFSYSSPPMFVLNLFAKEVAMMKASFEQTGREPQFSQAKELHAQVAETRKLLGNDWWSLERWFQENGFDKKLKPTPTPIWKKALVGIAVVATAVFAWYYFK